MPWKKGMHKPNSATGKKGQPGKKKEVLQKFWDTLDVALPEAMKFCLRLVKDAEKAKNKPLLERKYYDDMGLKAANIILSKAPQRIQGVGEGGAIDLNVTQIPINYESLSNEELAKLEMKLATEFAKRK